MNAIIREEMTLAERKHIYRSPETTQPLPAFEVGDTILNPYHAYSRSLLAIAAPHWRDRLIPRPQLVAEVIQDDVVQPVSDAADEGDDWEFVDDDGPTAA